jgi:uncharacterized membrane protein
MSFLNTGSRSDLIVVILLVFLVEVIAAIVGIVSLLVLLAGSVHYRFSVGVTTAYRINGWFE